MSKISKENKLVFVMGDFNVNLLNYESHNETNDFINTMVSHYLLPHILHPTRVTDHSATVIDNIFPIIPLIKLSVETLLLRSLIISHNLLYWTKLLLIINHAHMQNETLQTLMNRSLLLGSLLRVWTFCMMQVCQSTLNLITFI